SWASTGRAASACTWRTPRSATWCCDPPSVSTSPGLARGEGLVDAGLLAAEEHRVAAGDHVGHGLDHRPAFPGRAVQPRLTVDPDRVVADPGGVDPDPAAHGHRAFHVVRLCHHDQLPDPEGLPG